MATEPAQPFRFLDLPAELRLMVYERHYEIIYQPILFDDGSEAYWPAYTIPSGLSYVNRQIYSELQALHPTERKEEAADLVCFWPQRSMSWVLFEMLERIIALYRLKPAYWACIREGTDTATWEKKKLDGIISDFLVVERKHNDEEDRVDPQVLKDFALKSVRRMLKGSDRVFHLTMVVKSKDDRYALNGLIWLGFAEFLLSILFNVKMDFQIKITLAKEGGFDEGGLVALKAQLGKELFGKIKWAQASEEEMAALGG
jgi:hypothetical protein